MVIGGNGQRPGAKSCIVRFEQLGRSLGRDERVATLVNQSIDPHELPSGHGHELPHPRGPDSGVGADVERRFDQRQPGQFGRQAGALEDGFHLVHIAARYLKAAVKFFSDAGLRPNPALGRGVMKLVGPADGAEQSPDALFLHAQSGALGRAVQLAQARPDGFEFTPDALFSETGEGVWPVCVFLVQGAQVQLLVDQHVDAVVQKNRLFGTGEHPLPELDLGSEGGRIGKG